MTQLPDYTIFPLGDAALTIDFGNSIDEAINHKVVGLFHSLKQNFLPGIIELVPAYSSLTVYYDVLEVKKNSPQYQTAFEALSNQLPEKLKEPISNTIINDELIRIPVCYDPEFALDMGELTATKKINAEEVIRIHTAQEYTVYMLGFLPGFTYMAKVDDAISIPRKVTPRINVEAGSVGIAGYQTGIYPLPSPGGWQIIGRTPLRLFNAGSESFTLLKPGNKVQFYSISKDEFNSY
ncbi:MAG: 5-oxoprolinase subunit PxpB [Bacteroidetes bacterium]|nr:5-oxoprolinase subunit PxpB [Bacteroidota bacterium]